MDLILWRHPEAVPGEIDHARVLTPAGQRQAEKIGRWLRKRLPESARILVSPTTRTQQAATALFRNGTVDERLAPGKGVQDILAAAGWPNAPDPVLVIGHQPTLGLVVSKLLLGTTNEWPIKKGALVWLRHRVRDDVPEVVLRAALAPDLA